MKTTRIVFKRLRDLAVMKEHEQIQEINIMYLIALQYRKLHFRLASSRLAGKALPL